MTLYTVKPGDTLSAIARRYGVKSGQDLYNHPANASFRAKRPNPNVIFPGDQITIPSAGPGAVPAPAKPQIQTYIGPGVQGGGILAVAGHQALLANLYSIDNYDDSFYLKGQILTAGLGLGGGVGVTLVIGFGGTKPGDFMGVKFGGWDFNVSLGGRWGDVLKGAKQIPSLVKIAKALQGAKVSTAVLKGLLKLSPDDWESLTEVAKLIRDGFAMDAKSSKPELNSFAIPLPGFGAGLEVSVFHAWGTVISIY